ncbi:hypothetical protein [Sphingomonas colocasiae]|uniref:Preprotein translocase subunit YajC n=1 Tax=Sphingomonas colocasiae TaxID=1848973 RepID=A0ABS7PRF5_9SPHN|nr:hypothetical protein [Sphingomonas colocasiae]MBY8823927.1 hypothetical protein [Sphingomonas colocasiae]
MERKMMRIRSPFLVACLLSIAGVSAPLAAQPAESGTSITAGMKVEDPQGGEVGTVSAVAGDIVTVKTDKHDVQLPSNSFTVGAGKLVMGMTQVELNAAVDRAQAEAQAKLAVGATVTGSKGTSVGTIDAIDDQYVTLKLLSGKLIKIQRSSVGAGPQGGIIGLTAEELEAQVAGSR